MIHTLKKVETAVFVTRCEEMSSHLSLNKDDVCAKADKCVKMHHL